MHFINKLPKMFVCNYVCSIDVKYQVYNESSIYYREYEFLKIKYIFIVGEMYFLIRVKAQTIQIVQKFYDKLIYTDPSFKWDYYKNCMEKFCILQSVNINIFIEQLHQHLK